MEGHKNDQRDTDERTGWKGQSMVKKIDSRNIRENNRKLIYHYIMKNGPVSRQDIVSGLHVSLPTVTRNLESLMEGNWIQTAEAITNTGAATRPPMRSTSGPAWRWGSA